MLAAALAATSLMAQQRPDVKLQDNAPDGYVVVPGDTLWGIAGKFIKDPWRWPEIWKLNQDEIRNPHRIYPGDVIVLDRSGAQPELRMGDNVRVDTTRLSPRVRSEDTGEQAIPSIPPSVIEPFLSRPLVIKPDGLDRAPRIIAAQATVYLGSGDVKNISAVSGRETRRPQRPIARGRPSSIGQPAGARLRAVFLGDGRGDQDRRSRNQPALRHQQNRPGRPLVAQDHAQYLRHTRPLRRSKAVSSLPTADCANRSQNVVILNKGRAMDSARPCSPFAPWPQQSERIPSPKWFGSGQDHRDRFLTALRLPSFSHFDRFLRFAMSASRPG
jgi:hypothetical protein